MINIASNQTTIPILMTGTGSSYPLEKRKEWQCYVGNRVPLVFEEGDNLSLRVDVRTAAEHLANIRTVLNPPISELAILFSVSRQAIYKWLARDSLPENDKLVRIVILSKIADSFKEAKIQRAGALLSMKNASGESLFDLLKTDKPYEKQLKELIDEARIMETNYQQSGLAQSNAKPTNDWFSSSSISSYREDHQ